MHTFMLKLPCNDTGFSKEFEFEADDAFQAFKIAHEHAGHKRAELWCNGLRICIIEESASGFWQIAPAKAAADPVHRTEGQSRLSSLCGTSTARDDGYTGAERPICAPRPTLHLKLG